MRTGLRGAMAMLGAAFVGVGGVAGGAMGNPTPHFANVQYGDGHSRQVLDIYLPPGPGPHPVVIWIHGGGWRNGSKVSGAERAAPMMARGFALVSINYRFSTEVIFPAQIHDVKGVVRWLRANAGAYNLDPERIGVWGASAGGHLAALAGTAGDIPAAEGTVGGNLDQSSRVQAVVSYFGLSDFFVVHPEQAACGSSESRLLGRCLVHIQQNRDDPEWAPWVELAELAGPITHVSGDDPPFYLAHGLEDTLIIPLHSEILAAALEAAEVPVTLDLIPGAGHAFALSYDQFAVDHFVRHMSPPVCAGDWNRDRVVSSSDLSSFITTWLNCLAVGATGADVNGDGVVNSADIAAFITAWLGDIAGGC